jgi:hypothetical protein|tara:strand:+ start:2551 stop:2997 length:447 start_codon:yes stop_codon:yes gene_type:complete
MDPLDYFYASSGLDKKERNGGTFFQESSFTSPTEDMFGAARNYRATIGKPMDFGSDDFSMSTSARDSILGSMGAQQAAEIGAATGALGAIAGRKAAKERAEMYEKMAKRSQPKKSGSGGIFSKVLGTAASFIPGVGPAVGGIISGLGF